MRVLVACECSGAVRDAFTARGHVAVSCDLVPSETEGIHHIGDALQILAHGWDMLIAFPPCTYLSVSGLHWNKRRPERAAQTEAGLAFVRSLMDAPIKRVSAMDVPLPYAREIELMALPNAQKVVDAVKEVLG